MLDYFNCLEKLQAVRQEQLLSRFDALGEDARCQLLAEIENLNLADLEKQLALLDQPPEKKPSYSPFRAYDFSGNAQDFLAGQEAIREGKVGCLVFAGGQGTRLGFEGPKGCFPISLLKSKSFFQLIAEKTLAAGKQAKRVLFLAIMTSPLNHLQTIAYFEKHKYFGLSSEQVSFFSQGMLPFLSQDKKLFLESSTVIAKGPNGNGLAMQAFWQSKIGLAWKSQGVEYVNSILIDNPLADPFDAELIGFHARKNNDITIKCIEKEDPSEKVGVVVVEGDKVKVVEYSELPKQLSEQKDAEGRLVFRCANISLFCWSMAFIEQQATASLSMHVCLKKAKSLDSSNHVLAWKFEYFIFDLLLRTNKIQALLYPRSQTFSPLKDQSGPYSPSEVRKALLWRDLDILSQITGHKAPFKEIELSCDFYYPTESLKKAWKGKIDHLEGYIIP